MSSLALPERLAMDAAPDTPSEEGPTRGVTLHAVRGGASGRVRLQPGAGFVTTPAVEDLVERCLTYLEVGYPVHLAGPPGTGKTTLALHLAALRGRPVTLMHGDDSLTSSDLVGRDAGYTKRKLVDNYVRSVVRTEEEVRSVWEDNRLTQACRDGHTLIYDEFNRSRAETNNVLLSILAEGVLTVPGMPASERSQFKVHPEFRAVFTSNPAEYAGTHENPDALLDRMISLPLRRYDRETEVGITEARGQVARRDAEVIVDVVREARKGDEEGGARVSLRTAIAIARVLSAGGRRARTDDPVFRWACRDLLAKPGSQGAPDYEAVDVWIDRVCALHGVVAGGDHG